MHAARSPRWKRSWDSYSSDDLIYREPLQKRFPFRAFFADFALATGSCNPKLTNCKAELVDCNLQKRYNEGTKNTSEVRL